MTDHVEHTGTVLRNSVCIASISPACRRCNAPGKFRHGKTEAETAHFSRWPGTFVAADDPREGQDVGPTCPNCQAPRPEDKSLGVQWRRTIYATASGIVEKIFRAPKQESI